MKEFQDLSKVLSVPLDVRIKGLLKIGSKEHLERLADGFIRCRGLGFYRNEENKSRPFHDAHDGVTSILQSDIVSIGIELPGEEIHWIKASTGLIGQVLVTIEDKDPIFCMHAIHTGTWSRRVLTKENVEEYREYLQIPEDMSPYGDYVWLLYEPGEFIKRLTNACKDMKYGMRNRLVRYVDFSEIHGEVPQEHRGFIKDKKFEREREFRFIFNIPEPSDPFEICLPSLRDISTIMRLSDFRKDMAIKLEDGTLCRGKAEK